MKFIHVTDTHFVPPGRLLYGLDPIERLRAAVADINAHHRDAAFAIFTGDLAHFGELDAYRALREVLNELALPYHLLLGNHDDRQNFLKVFPESPQDENGFVQFSLETEIGSFICLDTNEPGVSWGVLCDKRLDWLEAALARASGRPVYLFMHHPPFPVGIRRMDTISLRDTARLAAIARKGADIRHLFFGHLHRPIGGSWLGVPFTTMRGTNHQVALNFVVENEVPGSHEPPAYAIVFAEDGLTVVHFHDYLDKTNTFVL
jgi:Icc protein